MPASGLRILVIAEVSFESERRRKDELGRDIVVKVDLFGHTSLGVVGPTVSPMSVYSSSLSTMTRKTYCLSAMVAGSERRKRKRKMEVRGRGTDDLDPHGVPAYKANQTYIRAWR